MKNNIKYIKLIGIFVLALVISAACVKWDEETSPTLESASTVTLAVLSAGDSSVVISYSNSSNGYVALNLYEGTGNAVPTDEEDREAMLTGNVTSMEYYTGQTEVGTVYQYTFEGLVQDASYEVMGVANNDDGVVSEVTVQVVNTADSHPPMLIGTDPEVTYDPVLPVDGSVTLIFDETILYDDTKDLIFSEWFDGEDVVAGSVVVSGNMATVTLGEDLTNRDYVWLSYPEGAFTDLSGNLVDSLVTYFDNGSFVGLYWRAVAKDFEAVTITPLEEVVPTGFDIVVSFAEEVDASDVADGDITLTYDNGMDVLIKSVLASEVSALGNDLTITQSYSAPPGVEVTLNIPAGLLGVGIGNPNTEVTATWSILHPLQSWIGTFSVDAVDYASYFGPETWTVTTAPDPNDINNLIVTGIGDGYSEHTPITGVVDLIGETITFSSGSEIGTHADFGGPIAIYLGDATGAIFDLPIVGEILAGGGIHVDLLGIQFVGGVNAGLTWGVYETTWTPAAKKAARVYPEAGQIKELK